MKARSGVFSKVILYVLLIVLTMAICFPVAATTYSTTLITTVPETMLLQIELVGNGTVTVNNTRYTQSESVEIPRNSTVELCITPDTGNGIKSVIYNNQDYTKELESGEIVLPAITGDTMLYVSFEEIASAIPQTDDPYSQDCLIFVAIFLLAGTVAAMLIWKKRST